MALDRKTVGGAMSTVDAGPVRELRIVVTAPDYDEAVRFHRDVLGLPERES